MANNLKNSGPLFFKFVGFQCACASHDLAPLSDESSPETDFIPEPRAETLPPSKYGRKRARVERDDYVSWEKIVF